MKKLNVVRFMVVLAIPALVSTTYAADRCSGKVSDALIKAESVADMYFDMRIAQLQCQYVEKDQTVLNKIANTIDSYEANNAPCIKASQDQMVAYLGSEGTFENFYATLGNQMVLLNLPNPCDRALKLAQAMAAKPLTCGAEMAKVYAPWFAQLDKGYAALGHGAIHRICDKTDQ